VADTGGEPDPLQRLSTKQVYVVTRSTSGRQLDPTRLAIAVPRSEGSRIKSAMSQSLGLTRLQPNVFRLDGIRTGLVEDLVSAFEVVEVVELQIRSL
jgi:hypothetical protein